MARRVIGQQSIVEGLLTALLSDGHALLVGVPGLAKTLLVSTLAQAMHLKFSMVAGISSPPSRFHFEGT